VEDDRLRILLRRAGDTLHDACRVAVLAAAR
jgi:hypothetical protein